MCIYEFIYEHENEIDLIILRKNMYALLTDESRLLWVLNDKDLKKLALSHGVDL
jgi:hypothetical protein